MTEDKHQFQAEVGKILDIVVNSLYSNKEIFLRELISNASDACDKLRYLGLTEPGLAGADFKIRISADKKARSVTVADNGVGMNRDDLAENLGTIARSGTTAFLDSLTGDEKKDSQLIGQFGVGFYASFSVAKKVEVLSRKAGEDQAWLWSSEGGGEYTLGEGERDEAGTSVTVHLDKGQSEYLEDSRLTHIVKTFSDHISIPIMLANKEGEEQINTASALWSRPKKEITAEQYTEFYHHVGHVFDEPWLTIHNRAEGKIEYTNLLFVPTMRPWDMAAQERKHKVKLYVKRVFITDDCEDLFPSYLRFVRGIIDSEDLPLNVSREMLQRNPLLIKIRQAVVKRIFAELKKKAEKAPDEFATFWESFGSVLKEGLYEDAEARDKLFEVVRFNSTAGDGLISLTEYVERMKKGQDAIYYITGEEADALAASPQLEGFAARGVEVLLLTDAVDEFWIPQVGLFAEKPFKSVTSGGADLANIEPDESEAKDEKKEKTDDTATAKLVLAFKTALGDGVKDVRASERLTDSAVCLVADEGDLDLNLERMLKQHGQMQAQASTRILEINPTHDLIRRLAGLVDDAAKQGDLADMAHLLFDQAQIIEGQPLPDPTGFSQRFNAILSKGLDL